MSRILSMLILLLISINAISQNVAINNSGTPPNASAGLDVDFPDKGILIPRVSLTGTVTFAPLAAHVAGMMVYNTATVSDVVPGFYYNDGTKWIPAFMPGRATGDMLYWDGTQWQSIPVGLSGQVLQLTATNIPAWGGGAFATLTTTAASAITATTASSGGNITSDGGSTVLSRGVCYGTAVNPTTANSVVANGSGVGTYVCNLTGLTRATTYYLRAYATNNSVTSYGNQQSFTTLAVIPTLTTTAATSITASSAVSGGNVTDNGGSPLTERGICYGTISTPTTANSKVIDPLLTTGSFVSNITGLSTGVVYYARSYAINAMGTGYGPVVSFTTLPTVTSTTPATSVTANSAATGGVIAPFSAPSLVYSYGVAYSLTSNASSPTKVQTGTYPPAAGLTFVTNLTGLTASSTYYIRAYASTGSGITVFGPELSFTTTPPTAPVIGSTTAITSITPTTANTGGVITSDGGSSITAKGVCWDIAPNPVLGVSNFTSNGTGTTIYISNITGLTASTTYYVRAYATNGIGTSYGPVDLVFTTCGTPIYTIGQNVGGGIVFYVDCTGQHGLIAATADQGTAVWGCSTVLIGTSALYGSGAANTAAILAGCATRPIAASLASTYTGGGFTDWYLPSSGELQQLMNQHAIVGITTSATYISSSENGVNNVSAYYWNGSSVITTAAVKTFAVTVRAIRSF